MIEAATADQLRMLDELAKVEPLAWIESRLWIKTKEPKIVPFRLNSQQLRLYALVRRLRREGRPVRIIILKARQIGFSTLIEAVMFERIYRTPNMTAFVVAHEVDAAIRIFDMSRRFYNRLPAGERLPTEISNRRELKFAEPHGSLFEIETARNAAGGRSATPQLVHFSESGFYGNDAFEAKSGTMSAVPKAAGTEVYEESTANGRGNQFHTDWDRAVHGESDFIPFFCPWHIHEEYWMPRPEGFKRTEEEEELCGKWKLTDEQLQWRRYTIRNDCLGSLAMFRQENPMTPREAFRVSGRPVFHQEELDWQDRNCVREPIAYRKITWPDQSGPKGRSLQWDSTDIRIDECRASDKALKVWSFPRPDDGHWSTFLITTDVAEGLEHGDETYITVWRRSSMEQMAEWRGHIDPDEVAPLLCAIGRLYNTPWQAPESNNHGHVVLAGLKRLRYPRVYSRRTRDRATDKIQVKLGWLTDKSTKPMMIGTLQGLIRERNCTVRSAALCQQLTNYEKKPDGKMGAPSGKLDDGPMAMAIAAQVDLDLPLPTRERASRRVVVVTESEVTGHRRVIEVERRDLSRGALELDDYEHVTGYP